MAKKDTLNENQETQFTKLLKVSSGQIVNKQQTPLKKVQYQVDTVNTMNAPSTLQVADINNVEVANLAKQQATFLRNSFKKAEYTSSQQTLIYNVQRPFLYREYDQMELFPEISVAWDIMSTEATAINQKGSVLNVYSDSPRIKKILDDLFVNRLSVNTNLRLWARMMCKYGDDFVMLNLDDEDGIIGCQQLPIYDCERREPNQRFYTPDNINKYGTIIQQLEDPKPKMYDRTKFILRASGQELEDFQVVHFRYITDAITIPYGTSTAFKARRYWRMLLLAEDAMEIYRIYRAMDRRVFKIDVGAIDAQDIPAYMQDIITKVKRKEIYDPQTGMVDHKFNIMGVTEDIFLPRRGQGDETSVEILNGSSNSSDIVDIKYWREKLACALRVPVAFLNFGLEGKGGEGKNLALLHTQFAAFINHIQLHLLQGLNQIARTHLMLLGFDEEVTNFQLSLNNPSNQSKLMYLEELEKKLSASASALQTTDAGLSIMSWTTVMREIMGLTDDQIKEEILNFRLEKALAAELEKTSEIIKRTHYFDPVDNIYGDRDAKYSSGTEGEDGGKSGGSGGSMGGGSFGGGVSDMDFGDGDAIEGTEVEVGDEEAGNEGEAPAEETTPEGGEAKPETPMESLKLKVGQRILVEKKSIMEQHDKTVSDIMESYFDRVLTRKSNKQDETFLQTAEAFTNSKKGFILNEETDLLMKSLRKKVQLINEKREQEGKLL